MVDRDIPEEMVEKAESGIEDLLQMLGVLPGEAPSDGYRDEPYARTIARAALSAALEGCAVVQLPEPDGVEHDGGTYWTYPGGRVAVWPTSRSREDRVDRYRRMALAMLAAAEFDEKQHGGLASGSGVGDQP